MRTPPFQFNLAQAFISITLLGVLLGSISVAGVNGAILFCGVLGVVLTCLAFFKRERRLFIIGCPLILISVLTLPAVNKVALGSGHSILPCEVRVLDASGKPVGSANVRIRDIRSAYPEGVPVQPIPVDELGVSGITDASGRVALAFEFPLSFKTGMFVDESRVYISPSLWVQVHVPESEPVLVRLDAVTGKSYDCSQLPLPRTTIRLPRTVP